MNNIYYKKKTLNIINNNDDIDIHVNANEELVINLFFDKFEDMNINAKLDENAKISILFSGFNYKDSKININGVVNGNHNVVDLKFRAFGFSGNLECVANVKVLEKTESNIINEDLKGILEGGTISLIPVLEIDSNNVDAAHYATIGFLEKEKLQYLMQKGISEDKAKELLSESFIYNIFTDDFLEMIQKGEITYESK